MLFGQDKKQLRQFYINAWQGYQAGKPLSALETIVCEVIAMHPEYHADFNAADKLLNADYSVENGQTNPFLHLSLHVALREQIQANNPAQVKQTYIKLCRGNADQHQVEHKMLDCLAQVLWQAQAKQSLPDQQTYINCLNKLCQKMKA